MNASRRVLGSAVSVATYVSDGFNRANGALGTADSGQTWTNDSHGSVFAIASNQVGPTTNTDGAVVYIDLSAGVNDVIVSATFSMNGSQQAGLIARGAANTYYLVNITSTGAVTLYKNVSGSFTSLGTGGAGTVPTSGTPIVGLSCNGTTIKLLVNGSAAVTATDSAIASGTRVGFRHGNGSTAYRWDDFLVVAS